MQTMAQGLLTVGVVVLGTMLTRFLPFILFPAHKETPPYVRYLGTVLPFSVMGLLLIYCLKTVSLTTQPYGLPEAIAMLVIVILHWRKGNMFLSISVGTILYMILVQQVFV